MAIHASTYRPFRGRVCASPPGDIVGCFNASSDARESLQPPFRRETMRGRLLRFADRRIKIPLSDRKVRTSLLFYNTHKAVDTL